MPVEVFRSYLRYHLWISYNNTVVSKNHMFEKREKGVVGGDRIERYDRICYVPRLGRYLDKM